MCTTRHIAIVFCLVVEWERLLPSQHLVTSIPILYTLSTVGIVLGLTHLYYSQRVSVVHGNVLSPLKEQLFFFSTGSLYLS